MHDPPLTFPDLPRLELDQLLAQLVERAHEVIATPGRLRGLLRADRMVTTDLALPVLLGDIVDAARELVGSHPEAVSLQQLTGQRVRLDRADAPPARAVTF